MGELAGSGMAMSWRRLPCRAEDPAAEEAGHRGQSSLRSPGS